MTRVICKCYSACVAHGLPYQAAVEMLEQLASSGSEQPATWQQPAPASAPGAHLEPRQWEGFPPGRELPGALPQRWDVSACLCEGQHLVGPSMLLDLRRAGTWSTTGRECMLYISIHAHTCFGITASAHPVDITWP